MNRKIILSAFFLLTFATVFGQKKSKSEDEFKPKMEVGLNVTSTLAGFFNSGGDRIPADPFLISVKFLRPKSAIRLGFNLSVEQEDESISGLDEISSTIATTRVSDGNFGGRFQRNSACIGAWTRSDFTNIQRLISTLRSASRR
jgi:hypothetical protein